MLSLESVANGASRSKSEQFFKVNGQHLESTTRDARLWFRAVFTVTTYEARLLLSYKTDAW